MDSLRRKRTRRATRALQAIPVRESGTATPPFAFSLQWLGLQLNLQLATPLRRARRLAIFIPTDRLLDMPLR